MRQRLIDATYLSDIIGSMKISMGGKDIFPYEAKHSVLYAIADCDTIEAEPVRHGRWKTSHVNWRSGTQDDECTACGFLHHGEAMNQYKRCPNCGAIMDLKED